MPTVESVRVPHLALVVMHGKPELTGLALRESVQSCSIPEWDIEIADQEAFEAGERHVSANMAISFPGDPQSSVYGLRRPAEVVDLSRGRRTVLNIYDRPDAVGEYVSMGGVHHARLLGIAALLGVRNVLAELPRTTFGNYCDTAITIELCRNDAAGNGSYVANNVDRLRGCMEAIVRGELPEVEAKDFDYYNFLMEIHDSQVEPLGLDRNEVILPFEPLPPHIVERLGLPKGEYAAEHWNGINSSEGEWFGGVLRKRQPPIELNEVPTARGRGTDILYEPGI